MRVLSFLLCCFWPFRPLRWHTHHASRIASLIDPAKLAMPGELGANPRVQKAVY